jgi:hypothetical protein
VNQFLNALPKSTLAVLAIAGGLLLLILFDPPHTVCDVQLALFKDSEKYFLYTVKQKGFSRPPDIREMLELCRTSNSPGGCYELFGKLKQMARDLQNVSQSCSDEAASIPEIRDNLRKATKLIIELAWGEKPPLSYVGRQGWLNLGDVDLFCSLERQYIRFYNKEGWEEFREKAMADLPLAGTMSRSQVWERSIVSWTCPF